MSAKRRSVRVEEGGSGRAQISFAVEREMVGAARKSVGLRGGVDGSEAG